MTQGNYIYSKYIQIHALVQYTAALLNRDDSGLAKRLTLGGKVRTRVSSQCIKHHWRIDEGPFSLMNIAPDPFRTKRLTEMAIMKGVREILDDQHPAMHIREIPEEVEAKVIKALDINLYGKDGDDEKKRPMLLFGQPEIDFLVKRVAEVLQDDPDPDEAVEGIDGIFNRKGEEKNFSAFRQELVMPSSLLGALFGRFVAADQDASIDSAVSVIHPFTVHAEESEVDNFTAMEDFSAGRPGAGHLGLTEINSGIYYVYVCIDVPTLVSNTTGTAPGDWNEADRDVAAKACRNLAGLIATVSPGAKKGSTAPFAYADAMVVEIGERQPRNFASAYRVPVQPRVEDAKTRLTDAISECDRIYGKHETRRMFGFGEENTSEGSLEAWETLETLAKWIEETVIRGWSS